MSKQLMLAVVCSLGLASSVVAAENAAAIPAVGSKAPDFTLKSPDGTPVTLSKLTADAPVVLVVLRGYPGYQCPICMLQVANLMKYRDDLKAAGAEVVLVYPGPAAELNERADEFLKGKTLPEGFVLVTDPDYAFTNAYGLRWDAPRETAYPSTFVIGTDGVVRFATVSKTHGGRAKTSDVIEALSSEK